MYASISGLAATFHLPTWLNEITYNTRDAFGFGGDFSIYLGIVVAALIYLVLAGPQVRREAVEQERLLAAEPAI
jgi:hypothetical protein